VVPQMEHETVPAGPVPAGPVPAEAVLAETARPEVGQPGQPAPDPAPGSAGERVAGGSPGTGEPRVDAALRLLDRLPGLPVAEHPELFEQVHAQLTDVLGELDSGAGGAAGPHAS
jgi:hypothetical protein